MSDFDTRLARSSNHELLRDMKQWNRQTNNADIRSLIEAGVLRHGSIAAFAAFTGVPAPTMRKWYSGQRNIKIGTLAEITKRLESK